ncbi:MAG: efflux RND transporter periplasmic adaptor subunit, partial [Cytophagales bacterium]|nr:efflux RND transporter periplasmic adaptor subunit [Cytophagales bacterium]
KRQPAVRWLLDVMTSRFTDNQIAEKTPENVFYSCSMDPQVMEKKPGKCPICKMDLTKITIDKNAKQNSLKLSDEQVELANIKTMTVQEEELGRQKTLNAQLVINENKRFKISSRVGGRIERLYVKNSGEVIKEGTLIYELYSEELLAAQKEYLVALEKTRQLSNSDLDYNQIMEGAKNKLLLWGMSESQVKALETKETTFSNFIQIYSKQAGVVTSVNVKEGDYVMDGDALFEIADLSSLWVEAQIYSTEVGQLNSNDPVSITIEGFPEKKWNSRVSFAAPQLEVQSKINLIRAEIPNPNRELKPGMQANVHLKENTTKAIAIPLNAVLQDSKGATVWIKKKDGSYESRMVVTGIESNDKIEIRSGIEIGEEVVISGAYLLNSEYVFKKGMNPMDGHGMSKM